MPAYSFFNEDIDVRFDLVLSIDEYKRRMRYDEDGNPYVYADNAGVPDWEYYEAADHTIFHRFDRDIMAGPPAGSHPANYPMCSDAMGCNESQIKEFEAHSIKIGVPTHFNDQGQAILVSKEHRRKYAEARGFTDFDGGYSDPQTKYGERH